MVFFSKEDNLDDKKSPDDKKRQDEISLEELLKKSGEKEISPSFNGDETESEDAENKETDELKNKNDESDTADKKTGSDETDIVKIPPEFPAENSNINVTENPSENISDETADKNSQNTPDTSAVLDSFNDSNISDNPDDEKIPDNSDDSNTSDSLDDSNTSDSLDDVKSKDEQAGISESKITTVDKALNVTLDESLSEELPADEKNEDKKKHKADKKPRFSFLKRLKVKKEPPEEYDFITNGPLVESQVPEGYSLVSEYWILEGRSKVLIVNKNDTRMNEYMLFEPVLSPFEYELLERLFEDMRDVLILTDEEIIEDKSVILLEKMHLLLKEYKIKPKKESKFKLEYYLKRNFLGWSKLDPLLKDPFIEDISCDGSDIPVFLYHRQFRNIKTNVTFKEENLYSLAITLAQRSGKHISVSQPMLDATLPDGSRLQLTLGKEVTSRGTSFTIRKFRESPFTPVELMEYGTFSPEELVFFWLAIENNKSLLFVGGTASGKTSSLNAVSLFIPTLSKVVSIEDTREITLYHDNWIASVTRENVAESTGSRIDMFDLLKAAMRQRPEYILVGEVRGAEAQTLFQAMNTGHTTFSTLHANDVDAAIHRLENAPLNVPRNMVQALDIVSVQALIYRGQERVRRSLEIVEIAGIDPGTGNLRVNNVFTYDPVTDAHSYNGRSSVYQKIMEVRGWTSQEMNDEVQRRLKILNALHEQEIRDYISVTRIVQTYSINPEMVMSEINNLKELLS